MSPEPFVRGQAFVLMTLLVVGAVLGSPLAALVAATAVALIAWGLSAKYRGDVKAAGAIVPRHRERPDLLVAGDARLSLGVGLTASGLLFAVDFEPPSFGVAPATPVLLIVAGSGVYLSSLFDWYVILPRVSGLLGRRPCRGDDGPRPRYPSTWRETTRWWYIHRILAALLLRFGLSFAIVLSLREVLDVPLGPSVVAGAALGGLASYLAAMPRAFRQAGHPSAILGQTVRVHTTEQRPLCTIPLGRFRVRVPSLGRRATGVQWERAYVLDVALEALQIVPAEAREGDVPRDPKGQIRFERYPSGVRLRDVEGCVPAPEPFVGCVGRCSGISWYCIENPDCFRPK